MTDQPGQSADTDAEVGADTDSDRLLRQLAEHTGEPVPPAWEKAFREVPRHAFLPDRLWLRDGAGEYVPCDREHDPEAWRHAAYSDIPLITHLDTEGDGHRVPSSSASAPSTVLRMLIAAELGDGMRVLEIGTGTGYHAALLASRLGADHVTSVEIDPGITRRAQANLTRAGFTPAVHCADGTGGFSANAPYDRIIATCSVRAVPQTWLAQTQTGGRIVTPWDSPWLNYGTLTLTRHEDGSASGPFAAYGSYMVLRGHRPDVELHRDVLRPGQVAELSETDLSPWAVAGSDLNALFAIGLTMPGVWHSWDTKPNDAHTRLWLADEQATSWASVDYDGHQTDTFHVSQHGPRHLWDEVAAAHRQWVAQGRAAIDRHGLTLAPDGTATFRLHSFRGM